MKQTVEKLRIGYFKEITKHEHFAHKLEMQLKVERSSKESQNDSIGIYKSESLKHFNLDEETSIRNVHYFDGTEDLELNENIKNLLNSKLKKAENEFNQKLKHLKDTNNEQFLQIRKFKVLNKESGIKYEEMNASKMVEKLLVVTEDAKQVWKAFDEFSPGFFTKVIQEIYSIGDNFSKKMRDDF